MRDAKESLRANPCAPSAATRQCAADPAFCRASAALGFARVHLFFHAALPVRGGFQLHLPRRHLFATAPPSPVQPLADPPRRFLLLCWQRAESRSTRRQIFVDLHQLIPQRRRFAQQPQHMLAAGLERPASRSCKACCSSSRSAVFAARRSRARFGFGFQLGHRLQMRFQAPPATAGAASPAPAFPLRPAASRCSMAPICLACDSSRPRVRSGSSCNSASRRRAAVSSASLR